MNYLIWKNVFFTIYFCFSWSMLYAQEKETFFSLSCHIYSLANTNRCFPEMSNSSDNLI